MQETYKSRAKLEEDRKKLMKSIKMTEEALVSLKPSMTGSVDALFSNEATGEKLNK